MNESKNIIIALVLSVLILFGSDYLMRFYRPTPPAPSPEQHQSSLSSPSTFPRPESGAPLASPVFTRDQALQKNNRVTIHTPRVHGSLNLTGAFFDDLTLGKYRETANPDSPEIVLLSPSHTPNPYQAFFRWVSAEANVRLPDAQTLWTSDRSTLTIENPVTLSWDNGQGLLFQQVIAIDPEYMFTITQRVINKTPQPLSLGVQGNIMRGGTPPTSGFFILYEGPLGVFDGTLKEVSYDSVKEKASIEQPVSVGWLGLTDKYWLVALVPDQKKKMVSGFSYQNHSSAPFYQVNFREELQTVHPNGFFETTNYFFAGAKELHILDGYEKSRDIHHFDLAVDFGWFYFLTKPIFYALDWLKNLTGKFWIGDSAAHSPVKNLFFPPGE